MPRFNKCPNPSAKNDVTGWLGAGTRTRVTGLSGPPRTTGGRVNTTTASFGQSLSAAPAPAASGQTWTGVGYFHTSVARTVRFHFGLWNNGSFVTSTAATDVAAAANQWYGYRIQGTLPGGTYNQVTFHLDLPTTASASGALTLSSVRLEQINDATMLYGDGDDTADGWVWDGTAGNSTSTQQDAQQITADDTGAGTDPVTVVDLLPAVDDTGTGSDTVTTSDADTFTAADTGSGTDTVTTADADNATVDDTATGTDQLTLVELLDLGDTATGADPLTVSDVLPDAADTGAGRDDVTALDVPYTQLLPYRPGPTYELVVVARIPAETGPPTFIEVDPIRWTSLRYTDELSKPQQLEASCLISTLPESITRRLEGDPNTELLLLRNGRPVFAGPLVGWSADDGDTVTVTAHGVLAYLHRMVVDQDRVFRQVDQFQIVAALVDGWQNSPFGHCGIDTTSVGESGQLRDGTYLRDEVHKVGQRAEEMGARINGFDIEVDPQSRRLQLWNPEQGVDRSEGEDAIVFDRRHITSGNVLCSFGPDDLASDGFGNSNTTDGNTLWSTRFNAELRAKYGRSAVVGSWSNIERQDTLDDHVQALVDSRARPLLVPGPNLRVTVDADLDDYGVGDTVRYEVHERLGVAGAFRVRRRTVTVAAPSMEQVSLEFV